MKGKMLNSNTMSDMEQMNIKSQNRAAMFIQKIGKGKRKVKVVLSKTNKKYLGKIAKDLRKYMEKAQSQNSQYEKQGGNLFAFLDYLENESKNKSNTIMMSYDEIDFIKMQIKEAVKSTERARGSLKWYNLIKKFAYNLSIKQNKYFLEEMK